jgi:hypothetical protein
MKLVPRRPGRKEPLMPLRGYVFGVVTLLLLAAGFSFAGIEPFPVALGVMTSSYLLALAIGLALRDRERRRHQ